MYYKTVALFCYASLPPASFFDLGLRFAGYFFDFSFYFSTFSALSAFSSFSFFLPPFFFYFFYAETLAYFGSLWFVLLDLDFDFLVYCFSFGLNTSD